MAKRFFDAHLLMVLMRQGPAGAAGAKSDHPQLAKWGVSLALVNWRDILWPESTLMVFAGKCRLPKDVTQPKAGCFPAGEPCGGN